MNVLVLCTGNSCRSQIADGYLRKFAGEKHRIFSAGIQAHGLNPLAVKVMAEDHVDISHHQSKTIDELNLDRADIVLTVCDNAKENCPYFPSALKSYHKNFTDPAQAKGSDEEILSAFRSVRDEIKSYAFQLIEELNSIK